MKTRKIKITRRWQLATILMLAMLFSIALTANGVLAGAPAGPSTAKDAPAGPTTGKAPASDDGFDKLPAGLRAFPIQR